MFAKYDRDGDRVLDEREQQRMQADLCEQKVNTFSALLSLIALTPKTLSLAEGKHFLYILFFANCSNPQNIEFSRR